MEQKLKSLKEEFNSIGEEYTVEAIKSYVDDSFIPIITFLKKSSVLYPDEVKAIEQILARIVRLSENIDENQENQLQEIFLRKDADLLKSSISEYLSYLLDFFIKNTPEKRLQSSKHEAVEIVEVKQIATETKDFLNISVDRSLTENDKYELFKRDIENQKIDIRFLYLEPESIDLWFRIINRSEYRFQRLGRDLIERNATELVRVIFENSLPANHIDFINLGVGAALKDYYIIKAMLEKMPNDSQERMNYIPIDYSIGILQKTMDFLDELMDSYPNKLHIEGILGDFFQLVRYSDKINSMSHSPKVFALLGNIFGNVDEEQILATIMRTMNSNDLLLLEVDLINGRDDDKLKEGYGSDEVTKSFLLNPIINYFKAENKSTRTRIDDFKLEIEVHPTGRVPRSKSVVTSAYYGENRERIELVHSHKYDLEALLDFMYERWKLGHLKTYTEQNACLLLLNKRSPEITIPSTASLVLQSR